MQPFLLIADVVGVCLWYCWLGLLTCKNRLPYNLYCVGGDVKHCTIQSNLWYQSRDCTTVLHCKSWVVGYCHVTQSESTCQLLCTVCRWKKQLCLCIVSKPAEKKEIEVGCRINVRYRSEIYVAKVIFIFCFTTCVQWTTFIVELIVSIKFMMQV